MIELEGYVNRTTFTYSFIVVNRYEVIAILYIEIYKEDLQYRKYIPHRRCFLTAVIYLLFIHVTTQQTRRTSIIFIFSCNLFRIIVRKFAY